MAWVTPVTHITGYLVTASDWNELVNNFRYLKGLDGTAAIEAAVTVAGTVTVNSAGGTDAVIAETGIDRASASAMTFNVQNSGAGAMELQVDSSKVWHAGNDGSGSTLDADLLDGVGWAGASKSAGASGDLTPLPDEAVSWSDISGATVSLDRDGYWVVIGVFQFRTNNDQQELHGRLNYDSAGQSPYAVWLSTTTLLHSVTVTQVWPITVTGQPKTAKLQAATNQVGGSNASVVATNTRILAFWMSVA